MKCAMCQTEIRGNVKKCPLCGSKVDYSAQIEEQKEQNKAYGSVKTKKKTSWNPPTPADREREREREKRKMEEEERMKNYSTSRLGMILAILGTVAMIVIQFLTFTFSSKDTSTYTYENLDHDLNNYKIWFGGLIIGSILIVIASYLIIRCLTNKFYNEQTIFAVILCIISIMLIVLSLSKLEDRRKGYEYATEQYETHVVRKANRTKNQHNQAIDDLVDQLGGY